MWTRRHELIAGVPQHLLTELMFQGLHFEFQSETDARTAAAFKLEAPVNDEHRFTATAVSAETKARAASATIVEEAFRQRMGWTFKWVSSFENDFNRDYHVSFSEKALQQGNVYYNYSMTKFPSTEAPGLSD